MAESGPSVGDEVPDESFVRAALREARRRRLRPFADDETICFVRIREYPRISRDFEVQVRYWEMRLDGQSHRMAEMLALRTFPGIAGTDSVFNQGRALDGSQFAGLPPAMGKGYVRQAEAAGVNPAGRYYCGPIARFPGDPRAWVSGRGDVARVCREEGWTAEGAVKVEPPRYADGYVPPEKYAVDPALVAAEVADRVAADPSQAGRRDELAAEIAQTRSGVHGK